ncbi:hypothetical protein O181_122738 [Austropuccinia psidii MF-1]|uniref:CCHC-type domain-containing protein n=1 Tax=Austropuccinia psidii MF-1 TaxID=1389203 RepID=A0A9Q3Q2H8_9BASI|nr:hypothetical protein [Austropuccinia psidii MF-1]
MASATKSIVAELNKGEKLNGDNYEIWHMKIQYVLEEQEALEALNLTMVEPEEGTTAQHKRDKEAFSAWKRKNSLARITLLSSMENDVMREFKRFENAKEMWEALAARFGHISVTRLRQLTIRFDSYKKPHGQTMKQHLRKMSNMINELKDAGHVLTDEQQVQAVIRSLPQSWEHMKVHLTHNENIKTFEDAMRHLELEEDRLLAAKPDAELYHASSSSHGASSSKRKRPNWFDKGKGKEEGPLGKKPKFNQHERGKRPRMKKLARVKCYNCDKKGHYARDCREPKKVCTPCTFQNFAFVSSSVFLTESNPLWTVDSGATDHVAKDRGSFVEF